MPFSLKRLLPVAFIAALALIQAVAGHGDAGATGATCLGNCEYDPTRPLPQLLLPLQTRAVLTK